MEGISGRVRRNVELERQLSIDLQEKNGARVEEEKARARKRMEIWKMILTNILIWNLRM